MYKCDEYAFSRHDVVHLPNLSWCHVYTVVATQHQWNAQPTSLSAVVFPNAIMGAKEYLTENTTRNKYLSIQYCLTRYAIIKIKQSNVRSMMKCMGLNKQSLFSRQKAIVIMLKGPQEAIFFAQHEFEPNNLSIL